MSRAHLAALVVFAVAGGLALAAYLALPSFALGAAAFLLIGAAGMALAARLFNRLAEPEERRRDLEDRTKDARWS
ncbi:MAG: hypothetical protein U1E56_10110 [Bauldia sp.]